MPQLLGGFTNIMNSNNSKEEKDRMIKLFIFVLFIKLSLLFIVYKYLWPYVIPKLFKSVTPNPSFKTIVLLYLMISFLL